MEYKSYTDCFKERVKQDPDWVLYRFLTYEKETDSWQFQDITVRDLYQKSMNLAYTMRKRGIRHGDRVVIFSMQDYSTLYSVMGCILSGVTFTILPPPIDEGKIERFISVLKSAHPKGLISNYAMEQQAGTNITKRLMAEAFSSVVRLKRIYSDKLIPCRDSGITYSAKPDDLMYLQYTSGSTSAPKGVRVTSRALMTQLAQCRSADYTHFDHATLGTWVPFFHNLGLVITLLMPVLTTGSTAYFLSTLQFLSNPKLWIRMLSDFKLTLTVGPCSAYDACTRIFTPEEAALYDLSHMTHLMNGSEYISPVIVERFSEMFNLAPNAMAPGYGLSECICLASVASRDYRTLLLEDEPFRDGRIIPVTEDTPPEQIHEIVGVGPAVEGLSFAIGNPKTGEVYPENKIGEIFVTGESVADGYWGGISANKNFHCKLNGRQEEFYKTGDLGFLNDGILYITGRIKEMLIVNGHNIYPSDLMTLIHKKVPGLGSSTMGFFSVKDETKENIIAVVESSPEEDFDKRVSQINNAVSERFGFSFYDIIFVPIRSLPRTDSNKLQISRTKKLYAEGGLKIVHSSHAYRMGHGKQTVIDKSIDMADEVMMQVKSVFERVLRIEHFNLSDSFLELGGDSLMGYELLQNMEKKFGIQLDLREILTDSSVIGVTNYIHKVLAGVTPTRHRVSLRKECVLDESIRIDEPYQKTISESSRILLTGATGFLGAYLIRALIRHYQSDDLCIYCLVRSDSEEAARERLIKNLKHFDCWEEGFDAYLRPVTGDLSAPRLGMADDIYETLTNEVDAVFHNGALLNFVFPYEYLRGTNVTGTVETLRFACDGKPKYYHYISSYSVYDTPNHLGKRVYENDPLRVSTGFSLAYSETKWVSEKLVGIARSRNLHAVIYRPGDITGAENGVWALEDMVSRMIVGMIQMGCIPHTTYCMHMTPVDYVADAVAYISTRPEAIGHAFNIINPHPLRARNLINMIRQCGYPIRYITFLRWRSMLKSANSSDNSLAILECLFESGTDTNPGILRHFIGKNTTYDTSNTSLLLNGTGITCPAIDRKRIAAYLKHFAKLGYIPAGS